MSKQYEDWSPEAAAEEEAQSKAEGGFGPPYVKLREGRNVVRILPPLPGQRSPFVRIWQHFLKDAEGNTVVFECPQRGKPSHEAQRCPACAEAERLDKSPNPVDKKRARDLWPSRRVFANAIDRGDEDAGVKLLAVGKTIHEELLNIAKDPEAGGNFTHPVTGFDIVITRTGTGMDTRYKVTAARSNSPLSDDPDEVDEWLDDAHDLNEVARVLTLDEIRAAVTGGALEDASPRGGQRRALNAPDAATSGRRKRAKRSAQDDAVDAEWAEDIPA